MEVDKFHFIAIGGVGQSALAKILLEQGYTVTGSDIQESKYTKLLKDLGAKVYIGHSEDNIQAGFNVVVSSAIKEDNPEIIKARKLGLKILHRSDMLKILSENCKAFIGFSGTHGKTTTSGLMSYVLEKGGLNPSFAVGGIIPSLNINAKSSLNYRDSYFIAELDESDGTIKKYCPKYMVINNLEVDHVDFYKNGLSDIFETFNFVCEKFDESSNIFINIDDAGNKEFLKQLKTDAKIITYGIKSDTVFDSMHYSAKNIECKNKTTSFEIYKNDKKICNINSILLGIHNVYNILAVVSVMSEIGLNVCVFEEHFNSFSGMGRRFEHNRIFDDIEIIDDYSHHPTEVKCALSSARNYTENRVVAIFQPHRYTRFQGLFEDFKTSFENCDLLFVTDVYRAGDKPIKGFEAYDFVNQINKENVFYAKGTIKEAGEFIAPYLKNGDTVLTIGAGDITKMGEVLENEYRKIRKI
ncbi:MAG: UDP-N-acetylmuramate--L-alanine ligase [Cyanobacteria bacterium SIG30]|nr:UDP-N-acetylmuramate--L-alanine ligase [Cyanobacteria bacterium SIG30]